MSDQSIYPPVGFYFQLSIAGGAKNQAATFKEVSGISMNMETTEVQEGGENQFKHQVPPIAKFSNLVLKRGLLPKDSAIAKWCQNTIVGGLESSIKPKTIMVSLLDDKGNPLMSWTFFNAYPIKWDVYTLNSQENDLVIDSLEFSYSYFTANKN